MPIISRSGYNSTLPKYNRFLEDNYQRGSPKSEKKKLKKDSSTEKKRKHKKKRENYTWNDGQTSYVSTDCEEETDREEDQEISQSNDQIKLIFDNNTSDTFDIPDCESSSKDICDKCHKPIRPPILQQPRDDDEEEESHSEIFALATATQDSNISAASINCNEEPNDRNSGIQTSSLLRLFTDKLSSVASHFGVEGSLTIHKPQQKQAQCGVSFFNEPHGKCVCKNPKCQQIDRDDKQESFTCTKCGQRRKSTINYREDVNTKEISSNTTIESQNGSRVDFQSQTSSRRTAQSAPMSDDRGKDGLFKEDYYTKSSVSFDPDVTSQEVNNCKSSLTNVQTYSPPKFDRESLYYKNDRRPASEDCDEDEYAENVATNRKRCKNKYNNNNDNSESDQSISRNCCRRRKAVDNCGSTGRVRRKGSQSRSTSKNKRDQPTSVPKSRDECTNEIILGNCKVSANRNCDEMFPQSPLEMKGYGKEDYYYKTVPFKERFKHCMPKFNSTFKRCKTKSGNRNKWETKTTTAMAHDSPMEWRDVNDDEVRSRQGKSKKRAECETEHQQCSSSNTKRKMKKIEKKSSKESVSSKRSGSCSKWRR
ncbi:uncharacterized protein LOC108744825 [Agrilus planipennis]|uniref:Uncharacterized protein LOC108744825 n=1 Tax=Agrilus planipennis TaxID=224129 RepID=A0A1W4XV18_AGRPL|nr:uncharacterized protein LOC108744825 [Agrilus planipennis]